MNEHIDRIREKVKDLPEAPGVYMFLGKGGDILYVGKAVKLRRRVSSYFRKGKARDSRLEMLVQEVRDIRVTRTSSEAEALIYEAGLIKDHSPKYNIDLKDDKSYPYLKLTVNEDYPRLFLTRRRLKDGALYYGPYVNIGLLKEALSFMKKVFPLRTCRRMRKKVCLEYHLEQCKGPCEGLISKAEYREIVEHLKMFLEGKKDDLIKEMKASMESYAAKRLFEKALEVKNRIEALTAIQQMHATARTPLFGELDELRVALDIGRTPRNVECFDISNIHGSQPVGSMVFFRDGKPVRSRYRRFRVKSVQGIDDYSMLGEVVRRRYSRLLKEEKELPDLVLIDGGKGHLSTAKKVLDELGLHELPAAGIAKEYNHLYVSGRRYPIRLSPGSRLLLLIQRIRDEAHRFAITYHRKLRSEDHLSSGLRDIPGIGPVKEKLLLDRFKKVENISRADLKELKDSGIGEKAAVEVLRYFHGKT